MSNESTDTLANSPVAAAPEGASVDATREQGDASGRSSSGAMVRHLFPRIPEYNARGEPNLYPGMPKFEGVAGLFNNDHGEVVVLAPTLEALEEQVRYLGITGCFSREKCVITEGRRVPNDKDQLTPAAGARDTNSP